MSQDEGPIDMCFAPSEIRIAPGALRGVVRVAGAKNAVLRHLAASLLTGDSIELHNVPYGLLDLQIHFEMLARLGKEIEKTNRGDSITISEQRPPHSKLRWEGRSIRNTLLILGALTARTGAGAVPLPGGCNLGERKYDLHEMVLNRLGAEVWQEGDMLCAAAPKGLVGAEIYLPLRSTGATENAILAATLAAGTTRIWNPHVRPEIEDLVALLRQMGAKIQIFGQQHIEISGVEGLHGAKHAVVADNMEAITWLVAACITNGDIEIEDFPYGDLTVVIEHLRAAGAKLYFGKDSVVVRGGSVYPVEISTGPHPGINSDVQPILAVWAAHAVGESRIIDLRFPGRYAYAEELAKMGLDYDIAGDMLRIHGRGGKLRGARVRATDLRAGVAAALCGLTAHGETVVEEAWQIFRGYDGFVEKLRGLGAQVSC